MATENHSNGRASETSGKSAAGLHKGRRVTERALNSVPLKNRQKDDSELEEAYPNSLKMLFEHELKSIYHVEKQLLKAFPEIAKSVSNENLKNDLKHHLGQTERHVDRLEKIFNRLRIDREGVKCLAMEALIQEGSRMMHEFEEGPVRDAAAVISVQKIEHYEICAYGSLYELADVLGYHKIADLLDKTLYEEENTDRELSDIGRRIHDQACDISEMEIES
jgi:ferritin-like metal-binding protein YciE